MPDALKKAGTTTQGSVSVTTQQKDTEIKTPVGENIPAAETADATSSESSFSTSYEGVDLHETLARYCLANSCEAINFNDGTKRKMNCFFIDKGTMDAKNILPFSYGKEVSSLTISQDMSSYGISASVEITDINGSLTNIIENQSGFYFVVGIFEILNDDTTEDGFMFQPFVFEIEDAVPVSPDGATSKIYRLELTDLISSALKKVSYGNLLLFYPTFPNCSTFVEAYSCLINFAGTIINLNHNKKFYIDTDIQFSELFVDDELSEIFTNVVINNVPLNTTCYELLNLIYTHAAIQVETPADFMGENVGEVLVPLFLQNEFEDIGGMYRNFFATNEGNNIQDLKIEGKDKTSLSSRMFKRRNYCKDLMMPFEMAFDGENETSLIYENINPPLDENGGVLDSESLFKPGNGIVFSAISDSVDIPPSNFLVGLGWKNLALMSETPRQSTNILVYWNWIYEFYKSAFLYVDKSVISKKLKKKITPNIDPHFHIMESNKLVGGDAEMFAKINANMVTLKSTNVVQEALYHVGRAIKSYIFMNSMFGFKIKGSIFRHPGEIIKINSGTSKAEDETATAIVGGLDAMINKFVFAYTTKVIHLFNGSSYENLIYANKICSLSEESPKEPEA